MVEPSVNSKRKRGRPSREDIVGIDAQVLSAAFSTFRSVGFDAAQMEAIAAAAGISKAALYRRFANKAELLCAVIAKLADELVGMAGSTEGSGNALERLRRLMLIYRSRAAEPDQIALQRLVITALPSQPSLGQALDALRESFLRPVDKLIAEALADKIIRPAPIALIREIMFNLLVNSVTSRALIGLPTEVDDEATFESSWHVFICGFGTAATSNLVEDSKPDKFIEMGIGAPLSRPSSAALNHPGNLGHATEAKPATTTRIRKKLAVRPA